MLFLGLPVQEQTQQNPQNQPRPNDPNVSNNPNPQLEHQRTSSLEQINTDTTSAQKPGPPTPKTERTSVQCKYFSSLCDRHLYGNHLTETF